jgi:peptidyl-prolyl cis-trans isomerase SurA
MSYGKTLAAGAAVLALVAASVAPMRAEIIEQVLVKVNGEIFTKTDLESRQVQALRQMGQQSDPKTSDTELRKMLNEVTPSLIVNVIDELLMVQRGRELGYKMGDEQFQSILANIKKDNKLEDDAAFQAALKQENMTLADLRRSLERQMIISRVQQNEVLGKVSVSDDEARRYYQAHLSEFSSPQSITLREIFVAVPGTTPSLADDNAARAKAMDIRRRALAGESFEKLAAELSDAPSKSNAGLIGPLNANDLSADVKALVDPMKPGDITEVLRGAKGYQLLKLESRAAPQVTPFEQAREDISNRVFTDKRKEEFAKYLEKARMEAIIEWKNEDLKRAFEEGVRQQKAAAEAPAAPTR